MLVACWEQIYQDVTDTALRNETCKVLCSYFCATLNTATLNIVETKPPDVQASIFGACPKQDEFGGLCQEGHPA